MGYLDIVPIYAMFTADSSHTYTMSLVSGGLGQARY